MNFNLRQGLPAIFKRWNSSKLTGDAVFKLRLEQAERAAKDRMKMWEKRDESLRKRYGLWNPTHKISRQQMVDIRELKKAAPHLKTVQIADHFNVNPESIRRILKSKWTPNDKELASIQERTEKRKQKSLDRKNLATPLIDKSQFGSSNVNVKSIGTHQNLKGKRPWQKYKKRPNSDTRSANDSINTSRKPYTETFGDLID